MSVGYSTLYGDSAGGFAVIKDCPKLLVYRLAQLRSGADGPIPQSILTRPPPKKRSAKRRPAPLRARNRATPRAKRASSSPLAPREMSSPQR
jgi:hypothetical protein